MFGLSWGTGRLVGCWVEGGGDLQRGCKERFGGFGYIRLLWVTMKQKNTNCKYCGGKLEAKTTRRSFCSNKCKVYWHRENGTGKATVKQVPDDEQPKNDKFEELLKKVEEDTTRLEKTAAPDRKPFMSDAIKKKLGIN